MMDSFTDNGTNAVIGCKDPAQAEISVARDVPLARCQYTSRGRPGM